MDYGSILSRRRKEIMGLAAMLIVFFHSGARFGVALWDTIILGYANIGVDIFVFLSGYGVAFSLERDPDFYRFYKRRVVRVLPVYYIAIIILAILAKPDRKELLSVLIPIGAWLGYSANCWYISATMGYYLFAPLIYKLILSARFRRSMLAVLMVLTGLLIPNLLTDARLNIVVMRIPALVAGIALGVFQQVHHTRKERMLDVLTVVLIFSAGLFVLQKHKIFTGAPLNLLTAGQLTRLWKNLMVPLSVLIIAVLLEGIDRTPLRCINAVLRRTGKYSLEIYLGHTILIGVSKVILKCNAYWMLALMLVFSYPVAVMLSWGGNKLLAGCKKLLLFNSAKSME